jgi:hypothetical protein
MPKGNVVTGVVSAVDSTTTTPRLLIDGALYRLRLRHESGAASRRRTGARRRHLIPFSINQPSQPTNARQPTVRLCHSSVLSPPASAPSAASPRGSKSSATISPTSIRSATRAPARPLPTVSATCFAPPRRPRRRPRTPPRPRWARASSSAASPRATRRGP